MAGPHFRPFRSIGGDDGELFISSELRWALGGYLPLRDGRLRLGVEFWGTTGLEPDVNGDNTFGTSRNTDVEWLAQARFLFGQKKQVYANFGAGTRLTGGYGAPDFRVLGSLGYWFRLLDKEPPSPPKRYEIVPDEDDHEKDTDGDGYPDSVDRCPTIREDGLPPDKTDGCPAGADRDHDGIPDVEDACPDEPEDKDGVLDQDGCPEEDPDNDGIPDGEDRCPTQPGPRSDVAEKNGCPSLTRFEEGSEIQLLEPIQFDFAKATIKKVSFPILDEVVALMKARTDLHIAVHGHTDSVGSDAANLQLSKARAKSCMDYLVDHGIARSRLESEGFGESKPIDTNDTAQGRAKNRRVEFKVIE
jgi:outer membrane protein OmpA-like peptidoglycan-associated protein